jgi:hypothetical protein
MIHPGFRVLPEQRDLSLERVEAPSHGGVHMRSDFCNEGVRVKSVATPPFAKRIFFARLAYGGRTFWKTRGTRSPSHGLTVTRMLTE